MKNSKRSPTSVLLWMKRDRENDKLIAQIRKEVECMTTPTSDAQSYPQEALAHDPSVTKEAFQDVSERVQSSEEKDAAYSPPEEQEIAAVADDVEDLTMGIEDGT